MTDDFRDLAKAARQQITQREKAIDEERALRTKERALELALHVKAYEGRVAALKTEVFPVLKRAQMA